jgi:hypothetical protein
MFSIFICRFIILRCRSPQSSPQCKAPLDNVIDCLRGVEYFCRFWNTLQGTTVCLLPRRFSSSVWQGDMPSYGKVQMVVIEYTGGITAHSAALQGGLPPTFCLGLTKAIQQLHNAGFVLGNQLRNMMVTEEDNLYLIDPGWTV